MDSDFVSFYERVCVLLKNTYSPKNPWDVQPSEKELISISEQYEKFLEVLMVIIIDPKFEKEGIF